jgi:hypothetical protein
MVQPSAERQDWERVLSAFHFPLSLVQIRKQAREVGGVDSEVHAMIGRLQSDTYDSLEQLMQDIREIYTADGVAPDKLPL